MLFTPEELEELRRADAEIEADFRQTNDEIKASRQRDQAVRLSRMDNRRRRAAESKKAYREANREKIAESKKAYYEANREKIAESKKAYREANREKIAESKKVLLKNHRKNLGLSQKKYSGLLGVSQATLSMWESGKAPINLFIIDSVFPELGEAIRTS